MMDDYSGWWEFSWGDGDGLGDGDGNGDGDGDGDEATDGDNRYDFSDENCGSDFGGGGYGASGCDFGDYRYEPMIPR